MGKPMRIVIFLKYLISPEDSRTPESLIESQQRFARFNTPLCGAIKIGFLLALTLAIWIIVPVILSYLVRLCCIWA